MYMALKPIICSQDYALHAVYGAQGYDLHA